MSTLSQPHRFKIINMSFVDFDYQIIPLKQKIEKRNHHMVPKLSQSCPIDVFKLTPSYLKVSSKLSESCLKVISKLSQSYINVVVIM